MIHAHTQAHGIFSLPRIWNKKHVKEVSATSAPACTKEQLAASMAMAMR